MRRKVVSILASLVRGPWTPLRLTGVTFGIAIFAVAITGGQRLYSYTQDDPTFCRSCHTMESAWTKWQTSEHSKVNCHSCHESNPVSSMEQVIKYVANQPSNVGKHAKVDDAACQKCHESGNGKWIQVADTAGHKVHAEGQNLACTKCHAVTVHRFAPPAKVCYSCHDDQSVKMTKMADRYCLDCHNFLRENSPLRPTRDTCLDCHQKQTQGAVHWPTDSPMQFQCSQCHQPHKQVKVEVNCLACHQGIKQTGLHVKQTHSTTDCTVCHKAHDWKITAREACTTCHADRANHNKGVSCMQCHNFKKGA